MNAIALKLAQPGHERSELMRMVAFEPSKLAIQILLYLSSVQNILELLQ